MPETPMLLTISRHLASVMPLNDSSRLPDMIMAPLGISRLIAMLAEREAPGGNGPNH